MTRILLASDSSALRDDIRSSLSDGNTSFIEIETGKGVIGVIKKQSVDLAILDMQMGAMGGIATCLELGLEESGGRLPHIPVLMLLDRRPDVFLARRAKAEGWIVKPLDPVRVRNAVKILLSGGSFHDDTFAPVPLLVAPSE